MKNLTSDDYAFHLLSSEKFENLASDVIHHVYGIPLVTFGPGKDGGRDAAAKCVTVRLDRDGRLLRRRNVIVQAKHTKIPSATLDKSTSSSVFGLEFAKVKKLVDRNELDIYIVVTNYSIPANRWSDLSRDFKLQGAEHVLIIGRDTLVSHITNNKELITIIPLKYNIGDLTQRDNYQKRKQSDKIVEYHENELLKSFVETKAYKETLESVVSEERHNVIILDGPKSGKSTILRKLGSDVKRSTTYDFRECICATVDEVGDHWNPSEKQVFIIDDVFGNQEFDEKQFEKLSAATHSKSPSSFVIASRNDDYQRGFLKASDNLKNVLGKAFLINLEEDKYKLDLKTKKSILLKHIDEGDNESDVKDKLRTILKGKNLESIVDSSNYPSFLRAAERIALKTYTEKAVLSFDWVRDFFEKHGTLPSETEESATPDQKRYKVWTKDGKKASVLASTFQELKRKGGNKLGFKVAEVTEEDGTPVDDEILPHLNPDKPLYFYEGKDDKDVFYPIASGRSKQSGESEGSNEDGQSGEPDTSGDFEVSGGSTDDPQQHLGEQDVDCLQSDDGDYTDVDCLQSDDGDYTVAARIHICHSIVSGFKVIVSPLDQQTSLTEEEIEQITTYLVQHFMASLSSHSSESNAYFDLLTATGAVVTAVGYGSLVFTVECPSLEVLNELWERFTNGRLNKMAQTCFITEEIRSIHGSQEIKLNTCIDVAEYLKCRDLLARSGGQSYVEDPPESEDGDGTDPLYTFNVFDEAVFIWIAANVVIQMLKIPLLSVGNAQVGEPQLVSRDENSQVSVLVEHNHDSSEHVEMEMAKEAFQKVKTKLEKAAKHVKAGTLIFVTNQDISSTQKEEMMGLFAEGSVSRQLRVLDRHGMLKIIEKSHDLHASVQQEWICKQIQKDHEKVETLQKRTTPALKEEGPVITSEDKPKIKLEEETLDRTKVKFKQEDFGDETVKKDPSFFTVLISEEGLTQSKLVHEESDRSKRKRKRELAKVTLQPKQEKATTSKAESPSEPKKKIARKNVPKTKEGPGQRSRVIWLLAPLKAVRAQKCAGCKNDLKGSSASVTRLCVKQGLRLYYHLDRACIARRHDDFDDPRHDVRMLNVSKPEILVITEQQRREAEKILGKVIFFRRNDRRYSITL